MRMLHRFRAYCRAVDSAMDAADKARQWRPPPPSITAAMATGLLALGVAAAFVFSQISATFAVDWFGTCVCFAIAILLTGPPQYRRWLSSEWCKHGQCPHCGFDLRHSPLRCPECGSPVCDADRKHMTVSFTATRAGAVSEPGFTKVWLGSTTPRRLLTLQRSISPENNATEIYITFDLEPHSTPGSILACSLGRETLHLQLTGYFNNRYDHFQISLSLPPDHREPLAGALRDILRGTYAKVSIE